MSDKEAIQALKNGECYIIPESDHGRAEVWYKHNTYFLFEIRGYGTTIVFYKAYSIWQIDQMIKDCESWT